MKRILSQLMFSLILILIFSSFYQIKLPEYSNSCLHNTIKDSNELIDGVIYYWEDGWLVSFEAKEGRILSYTRRLSTYDTILIIWRGEAYEQLLNDSLMTYKRLFNYSYGYYGKIRINELLDFSRMYNRKAFFTVYYQKGGGKRRELSFTDFYNLGKSHCENIVYIYYYANGNVKKFINTNYINNQKIDTTIILSRKGEIRKAKVERDGVKSKLQVNKDYIEKKLLLYSDSALISMKCKSTLHKYAGLILRPAR